MNEYYGAPTTPTSDYLAHYGVKGMKWGVRRYIDKQGKLTKAALKRYGKNSTKKTSARKMARDFNNLSQSAANKLADIKEKKQYQVDLYRNFMYRHPDSNFNKKAFDEDLKENIVPKMKKSNAQLAEYKKQALGMAKLQENINKKAKKMKTGNKIQVVTRHGVPSSQQTLHRVLNVMVPIPGLSYGLTRSLEKGHATAGAVLDSLGAKMVTRKKKHK